MPFDRDRRLLRRGARLLAAIFLAAAATAPPARAQIATAGALRGTVLDKDFEAPLASVRVTILEVFLSTLTNVDGNFVFERVPPGTYTLAFVRDGYQRQVMPNITVTAGQLAEVRAELGVEVVEMEEMVVSGQDLLAGTEVGLLEIRAEASTVQDAISSEIMSKAGVTDAAGALRLVVGASVVGGKYATVRGLSDRYTGTTLNGVRVPSSDPRRRAVQLDLFPTGTIESVTVTKSFTPDLQGDFTGGGVDIRTRSVPEGKLLSVTASVENNSQATGTDDFLSYQGGGSPPLGFGVGDRALPSGADDPLPAFPRFTPRPPQSQIDASAQYDHLVRSFTPVMGVDTNPPGLNQGLTVVGGNRMNLDGGKVFGAIGALTYTHKYDFYAGAQNNNGVVSDPYQPIALNHPRTDSRGLDNVLLGILGSFDWQFTPDQEVSLQLIGNQSAEDEARYQVEERGGLSEEQNQSLRYLERSVGSAQLHGRHVFKEIFGTHGAFSDLKLGWVYSENLTRQNEPDVRFFRNTFDLRTLTASKPSNSTDSQNTRRIFREIGDDNRQGGFDAILPFTQRSDVLGFIKTGAFIDRTDRDYTQSSFTYTFPTQFGPASNPAVSHNRSLAGFTAASPDDLWTDVFLDPDRIGLATNHPPAPNQLLWSIVPLGNDVDYTGNQSIEAFYAMAEIPFGHRTKVTAGARHETTDLTIVPVNEKFGKVEVIEVQPSGDRAIVSVPQEEAQADIHDASLLPAIGVVYEMKPGMNLRASWSRTIARPTFRELAPVATEEFIFGDEFIGNPDLVLSKITNYDLRWEWFPKSGSVLAASLFYKVLTDPIEQISFSANNRSFIQAVNFEHGIVKGFELEARQPLDPLADWLRGVVIGVNFTKINSSVDVPESEQASLASFGLDEPTRRLQGQPEYLVNFNVSYDNDRHGISAGLFYNLVGETLYTGAARGVEDGNPNVFDERYGVLDFTLTKQLPGKVTVGFKAKNLLTPARRSVYRTPDGDEAIKTERDTALLLSLAIGYTW